MFFESLESRTLLSSGSATAAVDLQIDTPPSIFIPGPVSHDLIFDKSRNQLIAIQFDTIARYDASNGGLLGLTKIDNGLGRGDITPDGKFLYIADNNHPQVYKFDLSNNTYVALQSPAPLTTNPGYSLIDVAIAGDKAITSEDYSDIGVHCCNYIRQIDLATDAFDYSSFSNFGMLTLSKAAWLARSADYSYTAIISPVHDYSIINNSLSGTANHDYGQISSIAVSRDGLLHAVAGNTQVQIVNSNFEAVASSAIPNASVAFDPHQDILYLSRADTDSITAYDTNTWDRLFTISVGENLTVAGNLAVSDDGQTVFLSTNSGIRLFHPNQAVAGFGQPVTFRANVSASLSDFAQPSGLVYFIDATTNQTIGVSSIINGVSTLIVNNLHAGAHPIVAHYQGDDSFAPSDSSTSILTINPAPTSATLSSAAPNSVTVTLFSPPNSQGTGSISLYEGNTLLSTKQVQSLATTFSLSLAPGVHSLQAIYNGAGDSLSTVSFLLRHVIRFPTTLTLTPSPDSGQPDDAFSFTAQLTPFPSALTETLAIYQDNQRVGFVDIEAGGSAHFSINNLVPGTYHFTASFAGDASLAPSSSNDIVHTMPQRLAVISMQRITHPEPNYLQLMVNVHAASGSIVPRGYIDIRDNGTIVSSGGPISGDGSSSFITTLSAGTHTFTATYISYNSFADVTSDPLTIEVPRISTAIKVTSSPKWITQTQAVHFTATLADSATGQVLFKDGTRSLGTAAIIAGTATLDKTFGPGVHSITASYAGNTDFFSASSPVLKITVVPATTIDLMVLYTPAARKDAGSVAGMQAVIDDSVIGANQAFLNSHIPVVLRVVYSGVTSYRESGKLHNDLRRLQRPHDGFMDEAPRLRNTYGADLVTLLESDGDLGGVGYQLQDSGDRTNPDFGYSIVLAGQAAGPYFSLAHELGHNLGATHDAQHREGAGATKFSNGFRFRGSDGVLYHDIMSYDPGETIQYFSNPDIRYQGRPTGTATANAARTITLMAPFVAKYRRSKQV